jgi:hypothetical protein
MEGNLDITLPSKIVDFFSNIPLPTVTHRKNPTTVIEMIENI